MSRKASGFRAWLLQRVSAIYLALYLLYLAYHFSINPPADYASWYAWLAQPVTSIFMALFFLSLLLHAWIGVRDIIIDYVHPLAARLLALTAVALLLVGCGFWVLRILVLVAL